MFKRQKTSVLDTKNFLWLNPDYERVSTNLRKNKMSRIAFMLRQCSRSRTLCPKFRIRMVRRKIEDKIDTNTDLAQYFGPSTAEYFKNAKFEH